MKRYLFSLILVTLVSLLQAQVPEQFNFQGVIRNSAGELISNSTIGLQISLIEEVSTATASYIEQHTVNTNNYGQFSIKVGSGTVQSGLFSDIDWSTGNVFIKTEIDETGGTNYIELSTVQLITVPFALFAKDVANKDDADASTTNEIQDISLTGTNLSISSGSTVDLSILQDGVDDADNIPTNELQNLQLDGDTLKISDGNQVIFPYDSSKWVIQGNTMYYNGGNVGIGSSNPVSNLEVKALNSGIEALFQVINANNDTVFAVYPDGVKVFIDPAAKGKVGGFAVSGRNPSKAGDVDIMKVTIDSTRIYVSDTLQAKGKVGGFAVSGRNPSKGLVYDYLVVTGDSTRVYVNDTITTKGKVGGFAVSGRNPSKSSTSSIMNLTKRNYFIGHKSGSQVSDGVFNSTLGYESGIGLTAGSSNAFLGYQSGYNTSTGSGNLFLGYQSGFSNITGDYNTFLGYQAGQLNVDGKNNSFLGSFAGKNNISGSYNTFVGDSTGFINISGSSNTFLGTKVGFNNTIGWANLFLGNYAGFSNQGGFENVFLGDHSGYSNVASGLNVAIGVRSGFYGVDGWNNVYIGTETGYNNIDGEGNVFIGYQTGMNNTNGTRNIFIGNRAGLDQQGSDKLIIDNKDEDSTSTFIWGDLLADHLRFNAHIGIGAQPGYYSVAVYEAADPAILSLMGVGNAYDYSQLKLEADIGNDTIGYHLIHDIEKRFRLFYNDGNNLFPRIGVDSTGKVMIGGPWVDATEMLDVDGNARFRSIGSGSYQGALNYSSDGSLTTTTSDVRLKENISTIENSLKMVSELRGVTFTWKENPEMGNKIGFIAQEVEKVIPELVFTNPVDGYKGVNYAEMTAVLVEAIKDLKAENELLKQKIDEIMKMLKDE